MITLTARPVDGEIGVSPLPIFPGVVSLNGAGSSSLTCPDKPGRGCQLPKTQDNPGHLFSPSPTAGGVLYN